MRIERWLTALDERHLAELTPVEAARALRALSSCYVERRATLARGGALESAGKRAAFALFYAPLHFFVVREIVRSSQPALPPLETIADLGCGTGAAGAALALEHGAARVSGVDRHPWIVAEANRTYRDLGIPGRATRGDVARAPLPDRAGAAIVLAYILNELPEPVRDRLLPRLVAAHGQGVPILIVEPIARTIAPWWGVWERAFARAGGRTDEWRLAVSLPQRQRELAIAAGLDVGELTARSLWVV